MHSNVILKRQPIISCFVRQVKEDNDNWLIRKRSAHQLTHAKQKRHQIAPQLYEINEHSRKHWRPQQQLQQPRLEQWWLPHIQQQKEWRQQQQLDQHLEQFDYEYVPEEEQEMPMPAHQYNYRHSMGPKRLLSPKGEFRKTRVEKHNMLFREYTQGAGDWEQNLRNTLQIAGQIRQSGLIKTPLIILMDRLIHDTKYKALFLPLYNAILQIPDEAKQFADRAQLLYPAIAQAFNAKDPVPEVRTICRQIKRSLQCYDSPERVHELGQFLRWNFSIFLDRYDVQLKQKRLRDQQQFLKEALQIQDMADALHESNCYFALVDAIAFYYNQDPNSYEGMCKMLLYDAYIGNPATRPSFADRPHAYFPWMLAQLKDDKSLDKMFVVNTLFRMRIDPEKSHLLPGFLLDRMHHALPRLFDHACKRGDFQLAQQIWQFIFKSRQNDSGNGAHLPYYTYFSLDALFLFSLHNWLKGDKIMANNVKSRMLERLNFFNKWTKKDALGDQQSQEFDRWRELSKRFAAMNQCYQELLKNPTTKHKTMKLGHNIFKGFVRDFLREGGKI